jgi:hypothetical protein
MEFLFMAKAKPITSMQSFGIYTQWDSSSKDLPQIQSFTTKVPAKLNIEFGFIVNFKKAKGEKLRYCIYHPKIPDDEGVALPPFEGVEYVKDNDWDFYLGDTLWEPINTKTGDWRMTIELNGKIIADKTFTVFEQEAMSEIEFWQKRGY